MNMKARNFFVIVLVIFFALNIDAFAQRGPRGNQDGGGVCLNIPELTQEQEAKIQAIRTERINQTTTHRAQMDELRARQRTLRIAENPNMAEIEKVIDQMANLRAEHMKANAAHQQSIREILTPEQRVYFDSRTANRPRFEQRNMRRSDAGRGQGRFQDNAPRRGGR
jgi:Spy/CpxP family protein refolding chaperone